MTILGRVGFICDYKARVVVLFLNGAPEGFRPLWREAARCSTAHELDSFVLDLGGAQKTFAEILRQNAETPQGEDAILELGWFWEDMLPDASV